MSTQTITNAAQHSLAPLLNSPELALLAIADTKLILGNWHIACLFNGKSLPDYAALLAMAGASLGHARALYGRLANHGIDSAWLERGRPADAIHSLAALDTAPAHWADYMATLYVVEHATWLQASTFIHSEERTLSALARRIGEESYFHIKFASGWLEQLGQDAEQAKLAQAALQQRHALALEWFINPAAQALRESLTASVTESLALLPSTPTTANTALPLTVVPHAHRPDQPLLRSKALPASLYERIRFKDSEAA